MIHWECDLCGHKATERMVRGLIWPKGLHQKARELNPEQQKRYQRTRQIAIVPPTLRFDICLRCIASLSQRMYQKGQRPPITGRNRRCCVCNDIAQATMRLYYGPISWPAYQFTGHYCDRHIQPLIAVSRPDGAKGGDRLLQRQGLNTDGGKSGKQAEVFVADLT